LTRLNASIDAALEVYKAQTQTFFCVL